MTRKDKLIRLATLVFTLLFFLPSPDRTEDMGYATGCKSNLVSIAIALEMYSTDHDGQYPRNLNQLTPTYIRRLCTCPATGRVTYRAEFGPTASLNTKHYADYYLVECTGLNHERVGLSANYPKYGGVSGLIEK